MATRGQEIVSLIKRQIEEFGGELSLVDVGTVVQIGDGIASIQGLQGVRSNELLDFGNDVLGLALNLEADLVGAAILGDPNTVKEGDRVRSTGRIIEVPVGDALVGRTVDPMGRPLDGKGPVNTQATRAVERVAPNVVARQSVDTPVQTGIKAIDSMIPIGRGQRELIIGDRSTGKTAIALDTIINQRGGDLICIYVAIGQKQGKVAQVAATLEEHGAMEHTIIVNAGAADSAPMQYIAPYAGCAMAEEFMDQGKDVLIVYDDLTKHAWAYRQMSLLLRRPAGREAYPGDIFYVHSRLLERAARLNADNGGGSMTALPIIETPVRAYDQDSNPLQGLYPQQGVDDGVIVGRLGRKVGNDPLNFLGKGAPLGNRRLSPPHFRGGDQRHGIGYLASVLHAADAAPKVLYAGHLPILFKTASLQCGSSFARVSTRLANSKNCSSPTKR